MGITMRRSGWRLGALVLAAAVAGLPARGLAADICDSDSADQATLNQCAERDRAAADRALNQVYQQVVQRLSGPDLQDRRKALVAAQRAWVAFRDAQCRFDTVAVDGGSASGMVSAGCLTGLTQARTARLKTYLACQEGDMSCPVPPAP